MPNLKTKLQVQGMTCSSCEMLIKNELKNIPGIHGIDVSCRTGVVEIEHDERYSETEVLEKINKLGYQSGNQACELQKIKTKPQDWLTSVLIVVMLYLAYRLLINLGLFDWININPTNISFGVALLVGIVASLSTCLMVVGAVIMSFSAKYQAKGSGLYSTAVRPHLLFHFGRLVTFFVLGGVLGMIGGSFQLGGSFTAWLSVIVAVILIWLGLSILGWAPFLSKFGLHLPKGIIKTWNKLQDSEHPLAPILLGGLTFFLPCGFTQSMQLFALSSGSFLTGAYTLLFFALGTTPVLLGLGVAATKFSKVRGLAIKQAIGMIVVIFALYTLSNGLSILGVNLNPFGSGTAVVAQVSQTDQEQVVKMAVTPRGYQPSTFRIKQGVPVRWIINGDQMTGCTSEIIVPSLKIRKQLTIGENIIKFTPMEVGTINFSCGMGMVKGKFIVEAVAVSASEPQQTEASATVTAPDVCPLNAQGQIECPDAQPVESVVAGAKVETTPAATTPTTSKQTVRMVLDRNGYSPSVLYAKVGIPVRWIIDGQEVSGCTNQIVLRGGYNITKNLKSGENIIEFTPKQVGEIPFSCGMDMVRGKFIITDDGTAATKPSNVSTTAPARGSCGAGGGGCGCGGA